MFNCAIFCFILPKVLFNFEFFLLFLTISVNLFSDILSLLLIKFIYFATSCVVASIKELKVWYSSPIALSHFERIVLLFFIVFSKLLNSSTSMV